MYCITISIHCYGNLNKNKTKKAHEEKLFTIYMEQCIVQYIVTYLHLYLAIIYINTHVYIYV